MRRFSISLAAAGAAFSLLAAPSVAAPAKITGQLSKPGYSVIALGYNGRAVVAKGPRFTLRAPDSRLTLALRDARGRYAGAIVLAKAAGGRLPVGLAARGTVKLGLVQVLRGYAKLKRPLPRRLLDRSRTATARKGAPLGSGRNFGLVRASSTGATGAGYDQDSDGVANAFDVDRNGNLVLNPLDRSAGARARAAADPAGSPNWMSQIFLNMADSLNAAAAGVTIDQIDAMLRRNLNLKLLQVPDADLVSLDCGGLRWCSAGGSGAIADGDLFQSGRLLDFPSCCDSDSDGFGELVGPSSPAIDSSRGAREVSYWPRAASDAIGSGDAPVLHTVTSGADTAAPLTLAFVFNTVPALATWDDGMGSSGSVSYPVAAGQPGTPENPIPVTAGGSGDVSLRLDFWRPQRRGIAGAGEAALVDVGGLAYSVDAVMLAQSAAAMSGGGSPGGGGQVSTCSAASMTPAGPDLSPSGTPEGGLVDAAPDRATDPANLTSFTVNLSRCLADGGVASLPVGAQGAIGLKATAVGSSDHAVQNIWVKRVA